MAEGEDDAMCVLDRFGEEYLNCTICQDRYKQPKILNCLHSFCKECLLKYQPSQGPVKLSCPVCRQETVILEGGVAGLKTNFPLSGIVEAFQRHEEKILASGRSSPAASERAQASLPQRSVRECRKHEGERTWFYCETCQDLVCRVCTTKTHREHEFQEIDAAALACRESLRGYLPRVGELLTGVEGALNATKNTHHLVVAAVERSRQEVTDRAMAAVAMVMDAKQRILDEIDSTEEERAKAVKEQTKSLTMLRDKMRHSLTVSEHLSSSATDEDLLSLFPIFQADLKELGDRPTTPPSTPTSFMRLLPATQPTMVDLGRLVVNTEKWKMTKKVGKWGSDKKDFDGARGVAVCPDGRIAVADMGLWTRGITFFTSDWTYEAFIKFADKPRDVASIDDRIVVADNTAAVKVYDAQRSLAFRFVTTPPGTDTKTPVNIVSVAVKKDGVIVVGDVERKVVTEHRSTDGELLRTIPTNVPPYFLDVGETDKLLLSGLDTGDVEEIDGVGTAKFTVRPVIAGEDQVSCGGVCYGEEGNFYVVVHGKESHIGHVHQYTSAGEFLGCVAQDLYDPNGIALTTRGELAVADCFSVKVYARM
ncbi:E3 ubiquitin-protein ligase TRIM56-like [Patiria miniata]|uniref:Uncharacterized protein n=1 Tax=Patiria miniata TaxID=46514 RepID=A0A914APB8_PATMI|nr:E3 ubiquitin-protein ligase TRIM56-like [Patiria miniata]XP_038065288.1 E3 ubiquitin-protein ligase TRIM56-like [Patiria miniata]XP_038065289.1 E3 ubiquitin-protein ligase TRIM56-like [Patiria miniata]